MAAKRPNPEGDAFEALTKRLLAVPHSAIKKAEEAEAEASKDKPKKRGRPKKALA